MKLSRFKKKGVMLAALILVFSLLIGNCRTGLVAQAATGKYYIKVNKGTNVVTVYTTKDDKPYTAFVCSAGNATRLGTFYTPAKYRWWVLDGPCYGQYCTRINGGILFHSVWYYSQTKNSQAYAQYNKLGTLASHGCVRLTVAASKWIYDNCPLNTKVIIFNGTQKDDPLGKPKAIKVSTSTRMGWDPTDPDPENPYKTGSSKPVITVSDTTLALGTKFGTGNMECKDSGGFDITDWVKQDGTVNMKKAGDYKVTYSVVDSFGRSASKTVTYKVRDINAAILSGVKKTLTKEYGNTRVMRVGLKAKNYAGKDLTDKIKVYIKAPGSSEYIECKGETYTFEKVGKYKIKYEVTNPANKKKTSVKATITVVDTKTPVLTSETDWADITLTGTGQVLVWDELMNGVSAHLKSGKDISDNVMIKIVAPSGTKETIDEFGAYEFKETGTYQITYTVKNPTKNVAQNKYLSKSKTCNLIVQETEEGTDPVQPEVSVNE